MQQDIINKFGKEVVQNFWIFIENLKFDSKTHDASTVKASLLKKLSPSLAEKYKEIADELAFSLYRQVFYDKKNSYLYAAFDAVAKGSEFYDKCWVDKFIIDPLVESLDQFNNFSTVLPIEDDYFYNSTPTPEDIWEDFEDYDIHLESIDNKKTKKKQKNENKYDDQ